MKLAEIHVLHSDVLNHEFIYVVQPDSKVVIVSSDGKENTLIGVFSKERARELWCSAPPSYRDTSDTDKRVRGNLGIAGPIPNATILCATGRLEYTHGNSNKFYEVDVVFQRDMYHVVGRYGRIGTKGNETSIVDSFSFHTAYHEAMARINQKVKKGYFVV